MDDRERKRERASELKVKDSRVSQSEESTKAIEDDRTEAMVVE